MQPEKKIQLHCNLTVRFAKWHGTQYKAISDEHRLIGRSDKSFEDATADLLNEVDLVIWANPLNVKYNITQKK